MAIRSAGLLIYRRVSKDLEVLLVHPGGPFWAGKDEAAWSIPKGLVEPGEDELAAAMRETAEELGVAVDGIFTRLGEYRQHGGKIVVAWSIEADPVLDLTAIRNSEFQMEWPPKSGRVKSFPEVDRAGWFSLAEAATKLLKGQRAMLADLLKHQQ
ncbi:putative NUDIX family NTP pyrophosphohydrolase [Rhizobium leguminosarum]|uniref:NUDIX family NTP pyrophosphohydrolase n=1 Tax=Rhizobium leguminosarum TaxID=384 RepID=A0AAE2SZF6_RHILE|nr:MULTISPECIES: NUDIX domain-containing protein [Rhizobium]MBB4294087.1 putative NUDIX family NTP pyrophosphohydrolase [Rhizobium leguminosarum]MBB4311881.1 putative NUDIX family NTP pyrophosphohydrolase [Rhizobium leguminosarum]MBB4420915.1 putative NUDIX family NTP pyrophosphohydrolase [Rhizobium leguminosarum]MBB4436089.1 putative NUDIX family NTP pyrophosphohydrolase [Rhizobium esperanzae]MBB4533052.1 putative NUDIX family NTP pyrophosphohydrolase [Rhizobium leguminosarum]